MWRGKRRSSRAHRQEVRRPRPAARAHVFPLCSTHGIIRPSRGMRAKEPGMTIAAILEGKGRDVLSVESATPVREAVALLAERRIGALPVVEGDRVTGILSERD